MINGFQIERGEAGYAGL